MFSFDNSDFTIRLSRGDTLGLEFQFEGDIPTGEDQVYFTVKRTPHDTKFKMEKKCILYGEDLAYISIGPEDTVNLPFGKYFWDLRVFYSDGNITTPVSPCPFILEEVVGNDR